MSWFNGLVVENPQNTKTQRNNQFIISEGIFNFLRGKNKSLEKVKWMNIHLDVLIYLQLLWNWL